MTRLETLKWRLEIYLEAERTILRGEEYQIGDRRLRRPDLASVRSAIKDLEEGIAAIELVGGRVKRAVFID